MEGLCFISCRRRGQLPSWLASWLWAVVLQGFTGSSCSKEGSASSEGRCPWPPAGAMSEWSTSGIQLLERKTTLVEVACRSNPAAVMGKSTVECAKFTWELLEGQILRVSMLLKVKVHCKL